MKVINKGVSGALNGTPWPEPGGEMDVPDSVAADLIAAGLVEPVKAARPKVEKRPSAAKVEKRG